MAIKSSPEQKYGGFTYIFDIGGSYQSVVEPTRKSRLAGKTGRA
jgi:hypothetical protein